MTEKIIQLLKENQEKLTIKKPLTDTAQFGITKMCQRIVGRDTKVLFLITYRNAFVCIIKMMRDASFNEKLKQEKKSQEKLIHAGISSVPSVYFDGMIGEQYMYAEEAVIGIAISKNVARKKEEEIVDIICSFPAYGAISTTEISKVFSEYTPAEDKNIQALLRILCDKELFLKKGLTHSDLGRPNIMQSFDKLYIIDWERAGDRPFWLIDAVYFMIKTRSVKTIDEWRQKAAPVFMQYTGVDDASATALYCVFKIFDIFHKKYPEKYNAIVKQFSC